MLSVSIRCLKALDFLLYLEVFYGRLVQNVKLLGKWHAHAFQPALYQPKGTWSPPSHLFRSPALQVDTDLPPNSSTTLLCPSSYSIAADSAVTSKQSALHLAKTKTWKHSGSWHGHNGLAWWPCSHPTTHHLFGSRGISAAVSAASEAG